MQLSTSASPSLLSSAHIGHGYNLLRLQLPFMWPCLSIAGSVPGWLCLAVCVWSSSSFASGCFLISWFHFTISWCVYFVTACSVQGEVTRCSGLHLFPNVSWTSYTDINAGTCRMDVQSKRSVRIPNVNWTDSLQCHQDGPISPRVTVGF